VQSIDSHFELDCSPLKGHIDGVRAENGPPLKDELFARNKKKSLFY